jgi:two-component system sporulation sensor kinase A
MIQEIVNSINESVVIFDLETLRILEVNPRWYEEYGFSQKELLSLSIADLWVKKCKEKIHTALVKFLEQGANFQLKRQHHQNKQGTLIWVDISFSSLDYRDKKAGLALIIDITDQIIKERQLIERSGYLEALLHNAPDAIITLDRNHRILEWNPGATALFGYTPEEAKGKDIDHLIARDNKAIEAKEFTQKILSGEVLAPSSSIRYRKDGSAVPVIVSGAPIKLDGELIGVVAVYKDISRQKNAEAELKKAVNNLESLIRSIDDSVIVINKEFQVVRINECTRRWWELESPEAAVGKKCYQVFHHRKEICPDCPSELAFKSVKPVEVVKYNEQMKRFLQVNVSPVFDSEGNVIEVIEIARDITKRRETEIALRESEARYRMLAEVSSELGQCVAVVQNEEGKFGIIKYVNDAVCQLIGYSMDELINRSFFDFIHPDYIPIITERYIQRQRGEEVTPRYEVLAKNRYGKQILLEMMIKPLIYEGQVASIAFFKDITQERSLEEQLQQARKLEAIGLLASGVAHNINTPLSAILGFAELLKLNYRNSWEIESIISQVNRIKQIIDNLMLKSSRDQEAEITEIDINNLLETELNFFEANMNFKHNIVKAYQFDRDLPKIKGVYSDFSQSLLNIIGNATDAMYSTPKKELMVRTFSDNGNVCVQVKDTGEGIPTENIPHLMEPFFSTKPRRGENDINEPVGTGLGLYSAHQLLSKYNANIHIESKVGEGSVFTIAIPCQTN